MQTSVLTLPSLLHSRSPFQAPVDETTKKLLLAAVGLVGAATAVGAARAAFNALQSRLVEGSETAQRVLITSGFLFAVFLAARAVLEN